MGGYYRRYMMEQQAKKKLEELEAQEELQQQTDQTTDIGENGSVGNENSGTEGGENDGTINTSTDRENGVEGTQKPNENESEKGVLTDEEIDAMKVDQLKAELDKLGVEYVHNTGEAKLKTKLKEAIANGAN